MINDFECALFVLLSGKTNSHNINNFKITQEYVYNSFKGQNMTILGMIPCKRWLVALETLDIFFSDFYTYINHFELLMLHTVKIPSQETQGHIPLGQYHDCLGPA